MNARTVVIVVVFALLALFAWGNWGAFIQPVPLSLAVTQVAAPLGVILLGVIALLSVLFLAYVVFLQGSVLLEARRAARELKVQRELADKAELSRFQELRGYLGGELARVHERLDRLDRDFGAAIERNEAAMAAYVGELGDRVDRQRGPGPDAHPAR